ncbi:hypothetical protein T265_12125 [Opisthorchis viverrini]|uniref:RRM domain-containing protein n=1 Tax=Opisthorchis viverrini TaxID=6198 RepID=A0A074YW02_OPIVI|nr:hypothetical protein T265_12125 [Opisthorchis viverrini]KER18858.1 hypothetical protein T265_12125 [Opisthorchis viverrini]
MATRLMLRWFLHPLTPFLKSAATIDVLQSSGTVFVQNGPQQGHQTVHQCFTTFGKCEVQTTQAKAAVNMRARGLQLHLSNKTKFTQIDPPTFVNYVTKGSLLVQNHWCGNQDVKAASKEAHKH